MAPRHRTSVWCGLVAGERLCNVMLHKWASWEHISSQQCMFRGQGPPACTDETCYSLGRWMKPSLVSAHPTMAAAWNHPSCKRWPRWTDLNGSRRFKCSDQHGEKFLSSQTDERQWRWRRWWEEGQGLHLTGTDSSLRMYETLQV